jgi:serine/threonine-protein kinase
MKLVGRYEVGDLIGEGATGDVYKAYDPRIDRVLAIKILKAGFRQNRRYTARFLREAKAAGALSHPNIVTIYDVGEVDGYPYIAMELLEGVSLDNITAGGGLDTRQVVEIGLQLADALRYAHSMGVVHRDIKPSNIMVAPGGRTVKILDFGIARVSAADGQDAETLATQIGQVIGTPRYMSPEQALGQEIDGRSDLFSVGAVLYELITGAKAFSASSPITLALQITQKDPPPIADLAPECPKGLIFIVGKLLAKRPERRFPDGTRLHQALRKEFEALGAEKLEVAGAAWRLPLQARVMLIMALATALALLLATAAVLDRQYLAMRGMALTSGSAIAAFVADNAGLRAADNATLPPAQRDWVPLQAFVRAAAADPNVRAVTVVDADGVVEASSDVALLGRRYLPKPSEPVVGRGQGGLISTQALAAGRPAFRFVRPITYAGRAFGKVDVMLDASSLGSAASLSRELLATLAAATLVVVMATSYAAARLFAMPIRRLKAAFDEAAGGNLDFRISHRRKDEFGELFDAFNRFTSAVQADLDRAPATRSVRTTPQTPPALRAETPPPPAILAQEDPTRIDASGADPGGHAWRGRWARVVAGGAGRDASAPIGQRP